MPELPEIETIRRSLLPQVGKAQIVAVEVRERRLRREIAPEFERLLLGRRVLSLRRIGKYLLFDLDAERCLLIHLGMSGRLELKPSTAPRETHDHVRLLLADGRALVFNDPRRFGLLRVASAGEPAELKTMGADSLRSWSGMDLRALLHARRSRIKNALMDQRLFAGIGNIYANEILFRAGIRPTRQSRTLRQRELEALAEAIPAVLDQAVRLGGSSISDFRDGEGRPGHFQLQFRVYDRSGEPCLSCATPIRRLVVGGRASFYCRLCQR